MLTSQEIKQTSKELKEHYALLNADEEKILKDLIFTKEQLESVLQMKNPNPEDVWKLRDYLEDRLRQKDLYISEFTVLRPGRNHWYFYDKTWK